jgi:hypothetical protein
MRLWQARSRPWWKPGRGARSRRPARWRPSCRHRRPRCRRCPAAVARSAAMRTAAGSTTRRSSCRSRRNSRVRPALLCQATTSGSNQFHWSDGSTRVPTLGPVTSRPLATSDLTASRTTVRLTPSSSHSVGSGGIDARRVAPADDGLAQVVERVAVDVLDGIGHGSAAHEQRDQRLGADWRLQWPCTAGRRWRRRQHVGRKEVLARPEGARSCRPAGRSPCAAQDEDPLRRLGAVEVAAKAHRALAQLAAAAGHQRRQPRLRLAFGQRDGSSRQRARPSVSVKRMTW